MQERMPNRLLLLLLSLFSLFCAVVVLVNSDVVAMLAFVHVHAIFCVDQNSQKGILKKNQ